MVVGVGEGARGALPAACMSAVCGEYTPAGVLLRLATYFSSRNTAANAVAQRAAGSLADADYHKSSAFGPRYWSPGQSK